MKIVAISDTHCQLSKIKVPDGDILLHAGDLTYRGKVDEVAKELKILGEIGKRFQNTVLICGNHDWLGEKDPAMMENLAGENGITWIQNERIEIDGVSIYGSAFTPEFCGWAFNLSRTSGALAENWEKVPTGIDILLTHGPSYGNLDLTYDGNVGDRALLVELERIKPKLHVFGHVHKGYGRKSGVDMVEYVNASICNESYDPINAPVVIDWPIIHHVERM